MNILSNDKRSVNIKMAFNEGARVNLTKILKIIIVINMQPEIGINQ
jgi:hypothetical protein